MAWFNHVSLGSDPQQQLANGSRSFTASDALSSSLSSGFGGPTEAPLTVASQQGTRSSAPRPDDFLSAPRGLGSPPSLENLTCSSFGATQTRDPEPISYVSLQEQRCVLSWFQGWTPAQRERFLQDLLGKAVPGKICTLLDSLSTLQVSHAFSPPNFQSHAQRCAPSNTKFSLVWPGQGQTTKHLWVPAAPVDSVVWVLERGGEESLSAHAGGTGARVCRPLLQECGRNSWKRLSSVWSVVEGKMLRTLQEDFVHEEPFHFNKCLTFDSCFCFVFFAGLLYTFSQPLSYKSFLHCFHQMSSSFF